MAEEFPADELELLDAEGDQFFERFRCEVDRGQSQVRVDKFLVQKMAGVSRNRIQQAAESGNVLVGGEAVKSNYRVKPGDVVSVVLGFAPNDYSIIPQDIPINVVYEDDSIIVVNKPAGMVVHPGFGNHDGTLLNAIAWHLRDMPGFDPNDPHVGLVHRIDKDTSGLLLVAKTPQAKSFLGKQFMDKTTQRTYNALVWGTVRDEQGTINGALARDDHDRLLFRVWDVEENPYAKHAVTHYRVLERFAYCTLVECRLETGRTHQIRVHMKHIGHPLFGDVRYGGGEILKGIPTAKYRQFVEGCFAQCPRQALHAKTLGFVHPQTNQPMFFDSDLPADLRGLIDRWRNYNPSNL